MTTIGTADPFGDTVRLYRAAGWLGTLPVPYGAKSSPPDGFTGYGAPMPSEPDVAAWLESGKRRNIALRMPAEVIGLDVDAYDGRPGAATLAELEDRWGKLPPTWRSSARPAPSGIRFYRVPGAPDLPWPSQAGPGIDVIRQAHRYAVVWPSKHPSGELYQWYDRTVDGPYAELPPNVDELPELPEAWVAGLTAGRVSNPAPGAEPLDLGAFNDDHVFTVAQAVAFVRPALDRLRDARDGEINNRLNDAAKALSHFGPEFWTREQAERQLHKQLAHTVYDGRTWRAETTIESAYRSAGRDWRATLAAERPGGALADEDDDEDPAPFLVDLGPFLDGTIIRQEPTVGIELPDGHRMLYAGKSHALIGETEAGKSWLALMNCAAEMATGNHVGYVHFEESDPSGTLERLRLLEVAVEAIRELFHFAGPESRITPTAVAELLAFEPTLVVLDGVNDGMALHGQGIYDPDGVANFRRRLVRPFTRSKAAVLELDHVTKNVETRGRDAFGSVHKGNNIDGARFALETREPFGRGRNGESRLYVTKDRPGFLREHGRPDKRTPGKTWVGSLVVSAVLADEAGVVKAAVLPLPEVDPFDTDAPSGLDDKVFDAVLAITTRGEITSIRKVRAAVGGKVSAVDQAVERLLASGRLAEVSGPRGARILTVTQSEGDDDADD